MSSFDKLLVNSTNRFSAVKNIIISQGSFNQQKQSCVSNVKGNNGINGQQYLNIKSSISGEDNKILNNHKNKIIKIMNKNVINVSQNHKNTTKCSNSSAYHIIPTLQQEQISQTYQQLVLREQQLQKTLQQSKQQQSIMLSLFQTLFKIQNGSAQQLKRRYRRKKTQIQNKYECEYDNCDKIYSTSTSLIRHVKLKHLDQQFQPPQPNYQIPPVPNLGNQQKKIARRRKNRGQCEGFCVEQGQYQYSQEQDQETQKKEYLLNYYNIKTQSEQQQQEHISILNQDHSQQKQSQRSNQNKDEDEQQEEQGILRNQSLNQKIIINYDEALALVKNKKTKINEDWIEQKIN